MAWAAFYILTTPPGSASGPHSRPRSKFILDYPAWPTSFTLANEPGTPNWSADSIPARANTRYQYLITTAPGAEQRYPRAPTGAPTHERSRSKAPTPSTVATSSIPAYSPPTVPRLPLRPSKISLSTSSTSAPSPGAMMASTCLSPRLPLSNSRIAFPI